MLEGNTLEDIIGSKVRERQGRIEDDALHIQATKGGDNTMLTSSDLTILLTWHQHAKVATMKKAAKLAAWVAIVGSGRAPPSFERWTDADDAKLLESQSDVVEMAHTAIGHLEELKKKELLLAAMTMTEDEFATLAEKRNAVLNESNIDHPIMNAIDEAIGDESSVAGNDNDIMGEEEGV